MYYSDTEKCAHYLECVREVLGLFLKSSDITQYQRSLLYENIKASFFF